jgi:hypothetical protein
LCALLLASTAAQAGVLSLQGDLNPDDANDVLLVSLTLNFAATLSIQTWGYGGTASAPGGMNAAGQVVAAGGFDTYLSLFSGIGATATFLASNDDGLCPPGQAAPACADSTLTLINLAPGDYTLALTLPFNYSFAENRGTGTLGDGFIGLDSSYSDGWCAATCSSHYALDITSAALVPEPPGAALLPFGLAWVAAARRRHRAPRSAALLTT